MIDTVLWLLSSVPTDQQCERVTDGPWAEPVAAWTSLAFVVGALVIVLQARKTGSVGRVLPFAALVAGVGIGSLLEHGPDPGWSDVAHDLPLLATLTFLGADAVADLGGRSRAWWWWAAPAIALVPLVVLAPRPGDFAQGVVAAVAVLLTVVRARAFPELRRRTAWALGLLAVGAAAGTMSREGWPWCDPTSLWQGHGVWHVLAAVALVVLAPTVGHAARAAMSPTERDAPVSG
ncbi:hypothetical protein [Cellulomonas terrae]|uniref:Ceramidase n=1 Tax=Cellulomonas terrae TaxID=311234 RepID=A0A511JQA6_9CELL|nr:hypothetical protein [Cellulomonas terrae]GEM00036.1 hypothetical protein CTE05_35820 [Cellulomonas terrae]